MPVVTKFPSANQSAGSPFNGAWTNPNNAHADDGVYATAAPGKNQEFASVWNVPFSTSDVPSGATINSVLVEVQVKCSTTASIGIVTSSLFADSSQATGIGAVPGVQSPATEPTADTTYSFTRNPTEAQVRDLWIRVQGTRGNSNTALTWSLDFVRATVNYTDPPAGTTGSGGGSATAPTASGAAKESFKATGAATARPAASSATGKLRFTGSASASVQASTAIGSGEVVAPSVTGTADVTAVAPSVGAVGTHVIPAVSGTV